MLYISPEEFYKQIATKTRLSKEEEIEYANNMRNGDVTAKEKLIDSYLPVLGAFLKRWATKGKPSMELIYRGIVVLEDSIQAFDFEKGKSFENFLARKIKELMMRYIVDGSPN